MYPRHNGEIDQWMGCQMVRKEMGSEQDRTPAGFGEK
jgi:hypothetical protein